MEDRLIELEALQKALQEGTGLLDSEENHILGLELLLNYYELIPSFF